MNLLAHTEGPHAQKISDSQKEVMIKARKRTKEEENMVIFLCKLCQLKRELTCLSLYYCDELAEEELFYRKEDMYKSVTFSNLQREFNRLDCCAHPAQRAIKFPVRACLLFAELYGDLATAETALESLFRDQKLDDSPESLLGSRPAVPC